MRNGMRDGTRRSAPNYSGPAWLAQATPRLVADNRGLIAMVSARAFKRRPVLRDVSVSVQRGEVVGLLGPTAPARPPASTSSPG